MADTSSDRPLPPRNADSAVDLLDENGLTAQLRSFEYHNPLRRDNAYPYRYPPDDNLVFYVEYRTCVGGPRLDTVALVGDVYLDTTAPDNPELYHYDGNSWLRWIPEIKPSSRSRSSIELCRHPFLTDVCLWAIRAGLGWYPKHTIQKDLRQYRHSQAFKPIARWMLREEEPTPRELRIIRKRVRLGEVEEESTAADLVTKGRVKKRKIANNVRAYTPGSRPSFHRQKPVPRSPPALASSSACEVQGFQVDNIGQEETVVSEKNSSLQAMIKSLQKENAKFKRESRLSNTKSDTLRAELTKLDISLQSANAVTAKFRDQITTLEVQNHELRDNLHGAAAAHTAAVDELVMKNTQIKTELQNMTERATTLEEQIGNFPVDPQTFMAESQTQGYKNGQPVAEVHSIQEQVLALHIENTRLQRDNKQILQKNVEVQAELQQAQARNIELSSRCVVKETNSENKYLSMPITELCLFAKRLEDELSKSNKTIQDLRNVQSNLKLELDEERKQRGEVAKRAKVAEAKLDDWMWRMTEMTTSLYNNDPSQ